MKSKAIARIVPINGRRVAPVYVTSVDVNNNTNWATCVGLDGVTCHYKLDIWEIEMLPAELEGKCLPPVGTVCEVCTSNTKEIFEPCEIVYSGDHGVAFVYLDSGAIDCMTKSFAGKYFRPIRSARDKAIEAISMIRDRDDYKIAACLCEPIYDAIAAGKIPGIKLEN